MTTQLLTFVLLVLPCYSAHGQVNPFGIPVSAHVGKFYSMSPRNPICNGLNYSFLDFTCCEGVRRIGVGLSCCGNRTFDLTQSSCCEGQLTLNVSQLVSDCCGFRAYDPLNQLCCDAQIINRTQSNVKCCGKELYNEDHHLCCDKGRKVLTKMSSHHRCCGDLQFDQQSHCCCYESERLSPQPLNASCCASSGFNDRGIDQSSPNCMPGEKPCGRGAPFNPTERCCVKLTSHHLTSEGTLSPTQGLYDDASCDSQVYNPDKICCAGHLSNRVHGKNLCCGTTPYGVVDRGVLCCNQTLHHGVEDGHKCSPGGHLYLPSHEMVCGSRVHLNDPGKHCCGEETYDPRSEICCNGLKHSRLGRNMSCCGGKAFDPSTGQMKCCAGTLRACPEPAGCTEEAQCCGSVLMEAGSSQTCCSAPGLDLLYPTQPGFTCCGHRYPNTSLWTCCAGVLHPRPEPHITSNNMIPGPRLLPLGHLKTEVLCDIKVLLGTVESVSVKINERSIVMVNVMSIKASLGHVQALPFPHYLTLPDHCSSPELVPGNTYIWMKSRNYTDTISFISDLSHHSAPLHSVFSRCSKLYF